MAAKLTHGSIATHLRQQTWPMVIGIAGIMSVGLVDAYFIGQLGPDELAAISFLFPVTVALGSLGVGVMVGINSVMARALGEGNANEAQYHALVGLALSAALGVTISSLLIVLEGPLFRLMNAAPHVQPLITKYIKPFALGFPLQLVAQGLNGGLRAQGAAVRSSAVLWTIAVANWILDPVLIAGWGPFPAFGIAGAAYASTAAFGLAATVGLGLVQTSELPLRRAVARTARWTASARAVASVGAPAALSNSLNPIGLSILTALLAQVSQTAVAGFGAAGRLQMFAVVPLLALSASIGSIVGQNWGARRFERATHALVLACGFAILYGVVAAGTLVMLRDTLAPLFSTDPRVLCAIANYLVIAAWGYAGYGVLIVVNGALNAVGRASYATSLAVARVLLVMIPVSYLGLHQSSNDASWVYAGELMANVIGGGAAAALAFIILGRRARASQAKPCPSVCNDR